ncbi:MAG: RHS repeat-associated core domain-containing protein [Anaerolineae bacterium]|nr:RHS repeat-associated core domain-containing protein [Anaerolineae bacterium]
MALQTSSNGTSWAAAAGWTVSPSYPYTTTASGQTYTFSGPAIDNVKGVRVVGRLNITGNSSKRARIREIYAYGPPAPASNTNFANLGQGNRWYTMNATNADTTKLAATGINDANTASDVDLSTVDEVSGKSEAAGVIFSNTQTVGTVKFINGTFNITNGDVRGPWASSLVVQYSLDGSVWQTATGWTLSPSYSYTNTTAGVEYTFTGTPIANVKGVRVAGKTWTAAGQSKRARVREVKAFANQNAVGYGAGKVWAAPVKQGAPSKLCERYGIVAANCKATTYIQFGSQRVAMREQTDGNPTGAVYWLHGDHLGSASLTTDATGGKVAELRYKPWGEVRWSNGAMPTDRLFTGMTTTSYGTISFPAREYSPLLGRFLSADSIVPRPGDPQSLNRFTYVSNSPLSRVDPDGHCDGQVGGASCIESHRSPITSFDDALRLAQSYGIGVNGIRSQVSRGQLKPVEGLTNFSEMVDYYVSFLPGNKQENYMRAMTILLIGVDPDISRPSVFALTGRNNPNQFFLGQNFLPYKRPVDSAFSEIGDWNPAYFDTTANQAYHFWFYAAVAYYEGEGFALAGNFSHDGVAYPRSLIDWITGDYLIINNENGNPGISSPDLYLGHEGVLFAAAMRDTSGGKPVVTNPSQWLKVTLSK